MPGQDIIIAVGVIGLAVSVGTPAAAIDVPGMTCSEVGSFAQRVAQQKATGVALNQAVPRLRRSFRREHADTEHELEKIVRAIYEMPIFSTVSPAEVGNAYRTACEKGQPRWSRETIHRWASRTRQGERSTSEKSFAAIAGPLLGGPKQQSGEPGSTGRILSGCSSPCPGTGYRLCT